MPLTIRPEPPLPDEALVLRGGMMLARDLALAAERCGAQLDFPGISVFTAAGTGFRERLLAAPALRTSGSSGAGPVRWVDPPQSGIRTG